MQRLLALHPLWLCLACLLLAAGAYISDSTPAAIAVAPLLFLSSTPLLIVVTIGQMAAALSLAYGLGNLVPYLPAAYALTAALLLAQGMLLPAESRIPSRLRLLWQYCARDLRALFWLIAAVAAAAALFRPVPIAPALGIAALHALFAWAMAWRYPSESRASSRAISAALLVVSTLFCVGFLELAARLLVPVESGASEYLTPDPDYLYRLTPGFEGEVPFWPDTPDVAETMRVRISELGIRDRDYEPKADGEYRVLLLGDSYTFGWALEIADALSRVVERELQEKFSDRNMTVVNGGTGGYGPWQTMGTFRRIGESIAPDLVIMQTNIANDISDTLRKENKFLKSFVAVMEKSMQRYRYHFLWQVQADQWLRRHCRLYYIASRVAGDEPLLVNFWNAFRPVEPVAIARVPQPDPRPWNYEPDLIEWYTELEHGWKLMQADLLAMKEYSAAMGADFAVYNMPNPFDIEKGQETVSEFPGQYTLDKNTAIVQEFCCETNTELIEVLSLFREHPSPSGLYYHNDGHLNPEGTRVLAGAIADYVKGEYVAQLD